MPRVVHKPLKSDELPASSPVERASSRKRPSLGAARSTDRTALTWTGIGTPGLVGLSAHDAVMRGVPVDFARGMANSFLVIGPARVYQVLGINPRTMQRRAQAAKALDQNAGDRALRLFDIAKRATEVFGSQLEAERWLDSPSIGLDQRKPIELLESTQGTEMVKTLLGRMEYGVYS